MSAISDIRENDFSTWTPEQNCFVEIWETNGLEDLAEKAASNYAAMQARIEKLEHLELVARDVNKWLINTGRGGTGHQRSLEIALEALK